MPSRADEGERSGGEGVKNRDVENERQAEGKGAREGRERRAESAGAEVKTRYVTRHEEKIIAQKKL